MATGKVPVEMGPNKGRYITKPGNFDVISSEADRRTAVAIFVALITTMEDVDHIEVEGLTGDKKYWVLCAYGCPRRVIEKDRRQIDKQVDGNSIATVFTDVSRSSRYSFVTRCNAIVVHMKNTARVHHSIDSMLAVPREDRYDSLLSSSPPPLASTQSFDASTRGGTPTQLGYHRKSVPIKRLMPMSRRKHAKKVIKSRGAFDKLIDWAVGVTEDDIVSAIVQGEEEDDDIED